MFYEVDAHYTNKEDTSKDGVVTRRLHQNSGKFTLNGLTTGVKYQAMQNDEQDVVYTLPGGCPWSNTTVERFRATAAGTGKGKNDCSFIIKMTWYWRTNDDCTAYPYDETVEIQCEE